MTRARKLAVALILAMSLVVSPLPVAAFTAGNADLSGMYVPIQPHWDNVYKPFSIADRYFEKIFLDFCEI